MKTLKKADLVVTRQIPMLTVFIAEAILQRGIPFGQYRITLARAPMYSEKPGEEYSTGLYCREMLAMLGSPHLAEVPTKNIGFT